MNKVPVSLTLFYLCIIVLPLLLFSFIYSDQILRITFTKVSVPLHQ